MQWKWK